AASTAAAAAQPLSDTLQGLGAPPPPVVPTNAGGAAIPFVVAASAGGPFGPDGKGGGSAADGYWRGYSLVRLLLKVRTVVEQRPAFDWIGMTAQLHALRPGQHETLRGYGREVMGTDQAPRYDDI